MSALYQPASTFLKWLGHGLVPLSGNEFGAANLQRLVGLLGDDDVSNRDWAVFYLSWHDIDTPAVRAALHLRLADESRAVREGAMLALAKCRDRAVLPVLETWLREPEISSFVIAATLCFAEPSLNGLLKAHVAPDAPDRPAR